MVNSAIQWLTDGKVQQSTISNLPPGIGSITPSGIRLEAPTTAATGVDAAQAWAPGPNALSTQSVTSDPDTTGQVRSYTTGPLTTADDDVRAGIVGDIMADAGPLPHRPGPGGCAVLRHGTGRRHRHTYSAAAKRGPFADHTVQHGERQIRPG
ncbi:hypothetical protein [Streptomyces sp. NPDC059168]|uniref:hypothetical protein n=1 Tax=Streptomyces sp. NPDC059168 TaxID=3346753 RepID=UPI0036B5417E